MDENTYYNKIRMNIVAQRVAAGLSQGELAEKIGVTQAHVSSIELGRRTPTAYRIAQIGSALNIPFTTLIDDEVDAVDGGESAHLRVIVKAYREVDCDMKRKIIAEVVRSLGQSLRADYAS
jgi:transcriptional regulator with XRE-family HTH domain